MRDMLMMGGLITVMTLSVALLWRYLYKLNEWMEKDDE